MDDETKHWPMPLHYKDDFDKIKFGYCAVPLAVYIGKKFVEPAKVNDAIKGALVEIHFEVHHFAILKKEKSLSLDSFNGTIEEIVVLHPGEVRPPTGYKRRNVREGPVRKKQAVPVQNLSTKAFGATRDKETERASISNKRHGKQKANESDNELGDDVGKEQE
jgi:hypothetical protein